MIIKSAVSQAELKKWQKEISRLLGGSEQLEPGSLTLMIKDFYKRKKTALLKLAKKYPTPFFAFDRQELIKSADIFKRVFAPHLPGALFYYAVKVNPHPWVLKTAVSRGFGLDVSSSRELKLGLKAGAKKMVFSGPGKTAVDLALALKHRAKVIVHLDSFGELERLGRLALAQRQRITAGVRVFTSEHGIWNKFGIPLEQLKKFFVQAAKHPYVKLEGIQFHLSWNASARPYQNVLAELAAYLKKNFSADQLAAIKFIDIGGGFLPYHLKGDNPWGASASADLIQKASEYSMLKPKFSKIYYPTPAVTLKQYAQGIGQAIKKNFTFLPGCSFFAEPGRVIVHQAMHLVMKVADIKAPDKIIMDAGVNLIGWEGLRYDYTPVVNLSRFNPRERPCLVYGCLCMADDIWSHSIYASKIQAGDLATIPNLGAYSYTLAQEFIKELPKVYPLPD